MTDHTDAPLTRREAAIVWTIWTLGVLLVAAGALEAIIS